MKRLSSLILWISQSHWEILLGGIMAAVGFKEDDNGIKTAATELIKSRARISQMEHKYDYFL
jgi:hypothetical protein